jgi:Alpha/beta hydrolase of unknown function (DUF1400)
MMMTPEFFFERSKRDRFFYSVIALLASMGVGLLAPAARGAERVVLQYSLLQKSVSVAELTDLAETGEVSSSLDVYLRMANQNPEEVRRALNQEVPADGKLLDRLLNSFPGEFLLDHMGEIIHTPNHDANRQALRSAIVNSALPDNRVTLIEILQNYPAQDLYVNGDRLAEIALALSGAIEKLPSLPF